MRERLLKTICLLSAISMGFVSLGQDPHLTYFWGEDSQDFLVDSYSWEGGFVLLGNTVSGSEDEFDDVLIQKISEDGDLIDFVQIDHPGTNTIYASVVEDSTAWAVGNYAFNGLEKGFYMIRVNLNDLSYSELLWQEGSSNKYLWDLSRMNDSTFCVAGQTKVGDGAMFYLGLISDDLELIWDSELNGYTQSESTGGGSVVALDSGGFLCTFANNNPWSHTLAHVSNGGSYVWQLESDDEYMGDLSVFDENHIVLKGPTFQKRTNEGGLVWENENLRYGAYSILDDGFIFAGDHQIHTLASPNSIFLTRMNEEGEELWVKEYLFDDFPSQDKVVLSLRSIGDGQHVLSGYKTEEWQPVNPDRDWLFACVNEDAPYLRVKEIPSQPEVSIFPNPFNQQANITLSNVENAEGEIQVFDQQGRMVQAFRFRGKDVSINRQGLIAGIYTFHVLIEGELPIVGRVVAM